MFKAPALEVLVALVEKLVLALLMYEGAFISAGDEGKNRLERVPSRCC